ncbi:MAG: hypothetical protein KGJ41_14550, partial [Rhodospirillales bacterium]|nr:hypothetical protein [Rhodospirillales bacterium]
MNVAATPATLRPEAAPEPAPEPALEPVPGAARKPPGEPPRRAPAASRWRRLVDVLLGRAVTLLLAAFALV